MYLVFVRHGKAGYGYDDFYRALTPEGIEALRNFYPKLENALRDSITDFNAATMTVLTSPKIRALQTAELLVEHLGLDGLEEVEELMNYSLASALKAARKTGSDVVFMVGHDPMCSVWVSELCQEEVSFKKGAAALVDYRRPNELVKPLVWYLSPGKAR